jgi:hypothetical protein
MFSRKTFYYKSPLKGRDNKFALLPNSLKEIVKFRDFHCISNIKKTINIQKSEKDVFKHYRGRWKLND